MAQATPAARDQAEPYARRGGRVRVHREQLQRPLTHHAHTYAQSALTQRAYSRLQGALLENVVVPAARQRGLAAEYEYLRPSIKAFPQGREQEALALAAGFQSVAHYEISFGLMGCLVAQKGR